MAKNIFFTMAELKQQVPMVDYHIHTVFTDGCNSVEEYARKAVQLGFKRVVFTEHVNRKSVWFDRFLKEVASAKRRYAGVLEIYSGIEAKVLSLCGDIDAREEMKKQVDVIMGVVHRYPGKETFYDFSCLTYRESIELEYRATTALLERGEIDVIGHLGGMCEKYFGPFPEQAISSLMRLAKDKGVAVELNAKYHHLSTMLKCCREIEPLLSLGSDAHRAGELGLIVKKLEGQV